MKNKCTEKDNGFCTTLVRQTNVENYWTDEVKNPEMLTKLAEKKSYGSQEILQDRKWLAGHVLRGSSGTNAALILEDRISGFRASPTPRRSRINDIEKWTNSAV